MSRDAVKKDKFRRQFDFLLRRLAGWLTGRKDIHKAYVTLRDGRLLFLLVRNSAPYDSEFEDSLSELDVEIANDTDLDQIHMDTFALPPVSETALKSFLKMAKGLQ